MFTGVGINSCFPDVPFPSIPPRNTSSRVFGRARMKAAAYGFCSVFVSCPGQHPAWEGHTALQREGVPAGASGVMELKRAGEKELFVWGFEPGVSSN